MSVCTPGGTHHHACACREARMARMEAALVEAREALSRWGECFCGPTPEGEDFRCDVCAAIARIDAALKDK